MKYVISFKKPPEGNPMKVFLFVCLFAFFLLIILIKTVIIFVCCIHDQNKKIDKTNYQNKGDLKSTKERLQWDEYYT